MKKIFLKAQMNLTSMLGKRNKQNSIILYDPTYLKSKKRQNLYCESSQNNGFLEKRE